MPHIHTEPDQHDITVSGWIIKIDDGTPRVLVHMHRKHNKLMQPGGHIELNETPWQTIAHELQEEVGYDVATLQILQPLEQIPVVDHAVFHPVPVLSNTHRITVDHYHSDYGFAFVASELPAEKPAEGESQDLRWVTIDELQAAADNGQAFQDVVDIYRYIIENCLPRYHLVEASLFSLEKPPLE